MQLSFERTNTIVGEGLTQLHILSNFYAEGSGKAERTEKQVEHRPLLTSLIAVVHHTHIKECGQSLFCFSCNWRGQYDREILYLQNSLVTTTGFNHQSMLWERFPSMFTT